MQKTKIDWCDMTWNPVTGCLRDCDYCYMKGIVKRFGGLGCRELHVLDFPAKNLTNGKTMPFPFGFDPTFHKYRLSEPLERKKPQTVFVGSAADLFGEWVPDEWIAAVFEACKRAPQHRYIFLTKNPSRYIELAKRGRLLCERNVWYGTSTEGYIEGDDRQYELQKLVYNRFLSIEPIKRKASLECYVDWVIVGAQTGSDKNKVIPQRSWLEYLAEECAGKKIPLFMKSSLAEIWGEPLIQQLPWEGI